LPTDLAAHQLNAPCNKFYFEWSGSASFYKIKVFANGQLIYGSSFLSNKNATVIKPSPAVAEGINFTWKVRSGCDYPLVISDWVDGPPFESFECRSSVLTIPDLSDGKIFPNPSTGHFTIDFNVAVDVAQPRLKFTIWLGK
jgi:hypothetical protein